MPAKYQTRQRKSGLAAVGRSQNVPDEKLQQAWRARRVMSGMLPGLTSLANSVSASFGGPTDLEVKIGNGPVIVDNKYIYMPPMMELGLDLKHERRLCSLRGDDDVMLCPACDALDVVSGSFFHEIAHAVAGSFDKITDRERVKAIQRAMDEAEKLYPGSKRISTIRKRVESMAEQTGDYKAVAEQVSPWLRNVIQALEDARVNHFMYQSLEGTRRMFTGKANRIAKNGIEGDDGVVVRWNEVPLGSQMGLGLLMLASDHEHLLQYLDADVEEACKDAELRELCSLAVDAPHIKDIFSLSFRVLERCRQLGFFQHEDDPEDDVPQQSSASLNQDPQPSDSDDQDSGEGEQSDSSDDPSDASDEQDAGDGTADDDAATDQDDSTGSGASGESDDDADDDGSDDDGASSDAGASSDEDASDAEPGGDPSGDDGDESDAAEMQRGGDADSEPGGDQTDSDSGDEESDDSAHSQTSDVKEITHQDSDDDYELGHDSSGGVLNTGEDSNSVVDPDDEASDQDDDEPLDMGDPEDAFEALMLFGEHSEPGEVEREDMDPNDVAAVELAMIQGEHFDAPSPNVVNFYVNKFDAGLRPGKAYDGWDRANELRGSYRRTVQQVMPSESILGPALLRLRRAFAENKKAKRRTSRSGRINSTRLASVKSGNKDVFTRTKLPGKRDYAVIIMADNSGSTASGDRIILIKEMTMALGELMHRVGVSKFAMYAHEGQGVRNTYGAGYGVKFEQDVWELKSFSEPWDNRTRDRVAKLAPGDRNLDGHAMEFARKQLESVSATDKIVLYVTDGRMPDANNKEETPILKRELNTLARLGIPVVGVGIDTESPKRHGLDTVVVTGHSDIGKVISKLEEYLT